MNHNIYVAILIYKHKQIDNLPKKIVDFYLLVTECFFRNLYITVFFTVFIFTVAVIKL